RRATGPAPALSACLPAPGRPPVPASTAGPHLGPAARSATAALALCEAVVGRPAFVARRGGAAAGPKGPGPPKGQPARSLRPGGEPGWPRCLPRHDGRRVELAAEVPHQRASRPPRAARNCGRSRGRPGPTAARWRGAGHGYGSGRCGGRDLKAARAPGALPHFSGGAMKTPVPAGARPAKLSERTSGDIRLLRLLFGEVRRYWPGILAALLLDLAAIPLTLLAPVPLKVAVDSVVGHR